MRIEGALYLMERNERINEERNEEEKKTATN